MRSCTFNPLRLPDKTRSGLDPGHGLCIPALGFVNVMQRLLLLLGTPCDTYPSLYLANILFALLYLISVTVVYNICDCCI